MQLCYTLHRYVDVNRGCDSAVHFTHDLLLSVGLTQIGSAQTRCNSCLHLPLSRSALLGSVNVQDIVLHLLRSPYCWPNCYAVVWSLDLHQVRLWWPNMTSLVSHQRKCGSLLRRAVNDLTHHVLVSSAQHICDFSETALLAFHTQFSFCF